MKTAPLPAFSSIRHAALLSLILGLILSACGSARHDFLGTQYDPRPDAPSVQLTDFDGRPFDLSNYYGRPILVFFGYTHCPDICPATVYNVSWVFDRLQSVQDLDALFVFITVDPARDTPERLRQFLGGFDSAFIGLTGSEEQLSRVYDEFGIVAQRDDGGELLGSAEQEHPESAGYTVTHTSRLFAIDKRGDLAVSYSFGTDPEEILTDVLYLIHEQ